MLIRARFGDFGATFLVPPAAYVRFSLAVPSECSAGFYSPDGFCQCSCCNEVPDPPFLFGGTSVTREYRGFPVDESDEGHAQ